jgi:hypothetical protein
MGSLLMSLHIVFPPAMYEGTFYPASLPEFVGVGVLDDRLSNRGEVESYCGSDLHFLFNQRWRTFFHLFDFFLRKSSVKFGCPLLYLFIGFGGV